MVVLKTVCSPVQIKSLLRKEKLVEALLLTIPTWLLGAGMCRLDIVLVSEAIKQHDLWAYPYNALRNQALSRAETDVRLSHSARLATTHHAPCPLGCLNRGHACVKGSMRGDRHVHASISAGGHACSCKHRVRATNLRVVS